MKKILTICSLCLPLFLLALCADAKDDEPWPSPLDDTFLVKQIEGTVEIIEQGEAEGLEKKGNDTKVIGSVEAGKRYPYNIRFRTGRNSMALIELYPGNTVRMLANTTMAIVRGEDDPRLVRVGINPGELEIHLDDYPKDHGFEVETPVGICGAVGTRFYIMYKLHEDGYTSECQVSCSRGSVRFWGPFVSTDDDTIRAGSSFAFAIVQCPQRRYAFLPLIDILGQDISLVLAGPHALVLADGTSIQAAMANVPGTAEYVAVRVLRGRILVGSEVLDENGYARFIRGKGFVERLSAEDYMNAAEWLCQQCARLLQPGVAPWILENIGLLPTPWDVPSWWWRHFRWGYHWWRPPWRPPRFPPWIPPWVPVSPAEP